MKTARGRDALEWLEPVPGDTGLFGYEMERFRLDAIEFDCTSGLRRSESGCFVICKDRASVEAYLDLLDGFPDAKILELGIAKGGSVALTALVARPRKLVALELEQQRIEPLDELIEARGLGDSVRPLYGVDQADRDALREIAAAELGGEPLDLVIDDASHRLEQTRASLETLFPLLRPGGLYLIEDWSTAYKVGRGRAIARAKPDSPLAPKVEKLVAAGEADASLTRLIAELVLAQAESEEQISCVSVDHRWVAVRRGGGELDPASFRLSDLFSDELGLLPAETVRSAG